MRSESSVRRTSLVAIFGVASVLLSGLAVIPGMSAAFGDTVPACLQPGVADVNINQGLPHQGASDPPLVRGKTTLVKFYLTAPSCPSVLGITNPRVQVVTTGSTLTVNTPVSPTPCADGSQPALVTPPAVIPTTQTSAQAASDADPIFKVKGCALAPAGSTAAFVAQFNATLAYTATWTDASGTHTGTGTVSTAATAPVAPKSNALRILVVPLISGVQTCASTSSPQFTTPACRKTGQTSSAQEALQAGFTSLARMLPVPDSVDDLSNTASTAGLRWHLNQGTIDLSALGLTTSGTTGKYCLTASSFDVITASLDAALRDWDTRNNNGPTAADRVIGAIDSNISLSPAENVNCTDGYATVNGTHGFVRAIHDQTQNAVPDNNDTGPIAGMETMHTWGLEPVTRASTSSPYHSPNTYADAAPDASRGLNTATYNFIQNPRSLMQYSVKAAPATNSNALSEQADWADTLCVLGGPPTPTCKAGGSIAQGSLGTSSGVAAGAPPLKLVGSGMSDGVNGENSPSGYGTRMSSTYFAPSDATTTPDPASTFYVVQRVSGADPVINRITAASVSSDHDDPGSSPTVLCPGTTQVCYHLSFSVPAAVDSNGNRTATAIEIWNGTPDQAGSKQLYTRVFTDVPVVDSVNVTNAGVTPTDFSQDSVNLDSQPSLSGNGSLLAWRRQPPNKSCSQLVIVTMATNARSLYPPACTPGVQVAEPALSADGSQVAFTDGQGQLFMADFSTSTGVTNVRTVSPCASVANQGAGCSTGSPGSPLVLSGLRHPAWSTYAFAGGNRLAFDTGATNSDGSPRRDLYIANIANAVTVGTTTVYPSQFVATNAQDATWSHAAGTATQLEFTDNRQSPTQIAIVDAATPHVDLGTGALVFAPQDLFCCGGAGSWGDRFIAVAERSATGTPAGIGLADYDPTLNVTPSPVLKTTDGSDTSPTIAATGGATDFDQKVAFDRTVGSDHEIFLLSYKTTNTREIVVAGHDPLSAPLTHASIYINCNGIYDQLAVALKPAPPGAGGRVEFHAVVDANALTCGSAAGGAPLVYGAINNGFSDSGLKSGNALGSLPKPPSVEIVYPVDRSQQDPSRVMPLLGEVKDANDHELKGTSLTWTVSGPTSVSCTCTDVSADALPAGSQFAPGAYTVTLTATDSQGLTTTATATVYVSIPAKVDFDPNTFHVPGALGVSTVYVGLPSGYSLSQIDGKTVRVTQVGDDLNLYDATDDPAFTPTSWQVVSSCPSTDIHGPCGVVKFDRTPMGDSLYRRGLYNKYVRIVLSGSTLASSPTKFSFSGYDPTNPYISH